VLWRKGRAKEEAAVVAVAVAVLVDHLPEEVWTGE
jgi:hypothetical protein